MNGMKKMVCIFLICMVGLWTAGCGSGDSKTGPTVTESREGGSGAEAGPVSTDSIWETGEDRSLSDSGVTEAEDGSMNKSETEFREIMEFMTEEYGFKEKELEGYDLIRLMKDYDFRNLDYTADEVREILEDQGKYYQNDGYTQLFYALNAEEGGTLDRDSEITRIGFYYNEGTLIRKVIYDLESKKIYDNSAEPKEMTGEQCSALTNLASEYGIYEWDNTYDGEEESGSTGSLRWKLVFECGDGSQCVYGGYTRDMTNLPERFNEIKKLLLSITE